MLINLLQRGLGLRPWPTGAARSPISGALEAGTMVAGDAPEGPEGRFQPSASLWSKVAHRSSPDPGPGRTIRRSGGGDRLQSRWGASLPAACAALIPLLEQSAEKGEEFPLAERALFMACDFWAAVVSGTLPTYLARDAAGKLRYMAIVYSGIGAPKLARMLAGGAAELHDAVSLECRAACLIRLQIRLVEAQGSVDQLIAGMVRTMDSGQEDGPIRGVQELRLSAVS